MIVAFLVTFVVVGIVSNVIFVCVVVVVIVIVIGVVVVTIAVVVGVAVVVVVVIVVASNIGGDELMHIIVEYPGVVHIIGTIEGRGGMVDVDWSTLHVRLISSSTVVQYCVCLASAAWLRKLRLQMHVQRVMM